MSNDPPQFEWEFSKENIQPIQTGRDFGNLSAVLHTPMSVQSSRIREKRQWFETQIRLYEGDDPLDIWIRYIKWTEQNFLEGGNESNLSQILEKCVIAFKDDLKYKNDFRYLQVWLKFVVRCNDQLPAFDFMFSQGIGTTWAKLYEQWALQFERIGNYQKADAIFRTGLECGAQPIEHLEHKHFDFQCRTSRSAIRAASKTDEPDGMEEDARSKLAVLQGQGRQQVVSADRISNASTDPQERVLLRKGTSKSEKTNVPVAVYHDENAIPDMQLPQPVGDWKSVPGQATHKENTLPAGPWNKKKVRTAQQSGVEFSEVQQPQFLVHQDDENGHRSSVSHRVPGVLSVKKVQQDGQSMFDHLQQQLTQKTKMKYQVLNWCKDKIDRGTIEVCFEEIRSERWWAKNKKEEEYLKFKAMEEALAKKENELRQKEAELKELKELLKEQQLQEQLKLHQRSSSINDGSRSSSLERLSASSTSLTSSQSYSKSTPRNSVRFRDSSQRVSHNLTQPSPTTKEAVEEVLNMFQTTLGPGQDDHLSTSKGEAQSFCTSLVSNRATEYSSQPGRPAGFVVFEDPSQVQQVGFTISSGLHSAPKSTGFAIFEDPACSAPKKFSGFPVFEDPACSAPKKSSSFPIFENPEYNAPKNSFGFPDFEDRPQSGKGCGVFGVSKDSIPGLNKPPPSTVKKGLKLVEVSRASAPAGCTSKVSDENNVPIDPVHFAPPPTVWTRSIPAGVTSTTEEMPYYDVDMNEDSVVAGHQEDVTLGDFNHMDTQTFKPFIHSTCNLADVARQVYDSLRKHDPVPSTKLTAKSMSTPHDENHRGASTLSDVDVFEGPTRVASTPLNYVSVGVLPDPRLSHIKSSDLSSVTRLSNMRTGNKPWHTSVANVGPDPLSPITECSNESKGSKSSGSSGTQSSNQGTTLGITCPTFNSTNRTGSVTSDNLEYEPMEEEDAPVKKVDASRLYYSILMDETQVKPCPALEASVIINPYDPFDEKEVRRFLQCLDKPLEYYENYHVLKRNKPNLTPNQFFKLGDSMYRVSNCLGEGASGKVFEVECTSVDDYQNVSEHEGKVAKVIDTTVPWEFYITETLHQRLTEMDTLYNISPAIMKIQSAYVYQNGSVLISSLFINGSILDLVNANKNKLNAKHMPDFLVNLLTIELLHILENMHKCNIIHGDIKPDNILVQNLPVMISSKDALEEMLNCGINLLHLIDFGQSIDLNMYPEGTTFTVKVNTSCFQCIEMQTNRPWTFQTDLFGLVGTIHVMAFGEYMKVYQEKEVWKTTNKIPRYFTGSSTLNQLFQTILNIPSCDKIPSLESFRLDLERELLADYEKNNQKINEELYNVHLAFLSAG